MGMRDDLNEARRALESLLCLQNTIHQHMGLGEEYTLKRVGHYSKQALAALSRLEAEAERIVVDYSGFPYEDRLRTVARHFPIGPEKYEGYIHYTPRLEVSEAERGVRQSPISSTLVYETLENVLLDGEALYETEDGNTAIDFHKITEAIIRLLNPGSAEVTEAWQPIATAPRDGTAIFAVIARNHPISGKPFEASIVEFSRELDCFVERDFVADEHEDFEIREHVEWSEKLTHWMPLPKPPASVTRSNPGSAGGV